MVVVILLIPAFPHVRIPRVRRRNCNFHVVSNGQPGLCQSFQIIRTLLPRHGGSNFPHPVNRSPRIGIHQRKVEFRHFASRFRVYFFDKESEFVQSCIFPGVDLELVLRNVALVVLGYLVVVASGGDENAQKKGANLQYLRGRVCCFAIIVGYLLAVDGVVFLFFYYQFNASHPCKNAEK